MDFLKDKLKLSKVSWHLANVLCFCFGTNIIYHPGHFNHKDSKNKKQKQKPQTIPATIVIIMTIAVPFGAITVWQACAKRFMWIFSGNPRNKFVL